MIRSSLLALAALLGAAACSASASGAPTPAAAPPASAASATVPAAAKPTFTLLFTGDNGGEIAPCG